MSIIYTLQSKLDSESEYHLDGEFFDLERLQVAKEELQNRFASSDRVGSIRVLEDGDVVSEEKVGGEENAGESVETADYNIVNRNVGRLGKATAGLFTGGTSVAAYSKFQSQVNNLSKKVQKLKQEGKPVPKRLIRELNRLTSLLRKPDRFFQGVGYIVLFVFLGIPIITVVVIAAAAQQFGVDSETVVGICETISGSIQQCASDAAGAVRVR